MSYLTGCERQDGSWWWILFYGSYVTQQSLAEDSTRLSWLTLQREFPFWYVYWVAKASERVISSKPLLP